MDLAVRGIGSAHHLAAVVDAIPVGAAAAEVTDIDELRTAGDEGVIVAAGVGGVTGHLPGEVDAVAFTSTPQVERLFSIAPAETVASALSNTLVAAVGPVVAETLKKRGITARVMPEQSFFLKPLTSELEDALAAKR